MKNVVIAVALATLLIAPGVRGADAPVARLVGISGNVLVATDFSIASAGEALRLVPGMRVLVTRNSAATIEYNDGCRVRVAAGERVEVRVEHPCGTRANHNGDPYAPVVGLRP